MEIRQPIHSEHAKQLDTEGLRRQFLVTDLFRPDEATLTYSQIDRIIVGGILPVTKPVVFAPELGRHTGTDYFLERRELGLINVGGPALVSTRKGRCAAAGSGAVVTRMLPVRRCTRRSSAPKRTSMALAVSSSTRVPSSSASSRISPVAVRWSLNAKATAEVQGAASRSA